MSSRSTTLTRFTVSAFVVVLTAAACGTIPGSEVRGPSGRTFIPMIPDSTDDVGYGNSITVDSDGRPYVSHFGFSAELAEGEIPVARPIGSPYLQTEQGDPAAAVLLAQFSAEQIWTRGAIAQPRDTPGGVTVPFSPATEPSLRSLTPETARGTDVAVVNADIHATWTAETGVWYGAGPSFEVQTIERTPEAGAPAIALDEAGTPLVAYAQAGAQPEVRVAERVGESWQTTTVATLPECGQGCPPTVDIAIVGGEPLVVVADPASGELIAAQRRGSTWSTEVVANGVTGGAALAGGEERGAISFYTEGGVAMATGSFGGWSTDEVADAQAADTGEAEAASPPTTGIAVDGQGTAWVAWEDGGEIHLASVGADAGEVREVELSHVEGGVHPSVAASEDGAVFLSWFDPEDADLLVGVYAETDDLLIAAPSPTPEAAAPEAPDGETCEPAGTQLAIVAEGSTFDKSCLAAPAETPFQILFENRDAGTLHNVAIYADDQLSETFFQGDTFNGPAEETYDVDPMQPGDFYFQCDVHPTTMFGAFIVGEAAGGNGQGTGEGAAGGGDADGGDTGGGDTGGGDGG